MGEKAYIIKYSGDMIKDITKIKMHWWTQNVIPQINKQRSKAHYIEVRKIKGIVSFNVEIKKIPLTYVAVKVVGTT